MMEKLRKLINSRLGVLMGVATGLLFLAVVAVSQAATEPQKQVTGEQKSTKGPQSCLPVVAKEQRQAQLECPPVKAPGKTAGQSTNECPPVICPPVPEKKQK
jgi:hypothetical protein